MRKCEMDKIREVERTLYERWKDIKNTVPADVTAARLLRIAVNALRSKPALADCSTASIVSSIIQAAQVGIEPDDATNRANLIPRKKVCCFELQYRGVIDLAYRSGVIDYAKSQAVHEADHFDVDLGTANTIEHIPALGEDRGPLIAAYCIVNIRGSSRPLLEVVDREDIAQARALADRVRASPAWRDWPGEMVKKFVLKRCLKQAPCSAEFRTAMTVDDAATTGVPVEDIFPDFVDEKAKADAAWTKPKTDEEELQEEAREYEEAQAKLEAANE
jgi:recombination protein RecT